MANRIKELRDHLGLSMQQLADRVGTTKQQISKLEKEQLRLTMDWMARIAPHLGVGPEDLMPASLRRYGAHAGPAAPIDSNNPPISSFAGKYGETIDQIRSSINQALDPLHPDMLPIALAAARQLVDVLERATAREGVNKSDPSSTSAQ